MISPLGFVVWNVLVYAALLRWRGFSVGLTSGFLIGCAITYPFLVRTT